VPPFQGLGIGAANPGLTPWAALLSALRACLLSRSLKARTHVTHASGRLQVLHIMRMSICRAQRGAYISVQILTHPLPRTVL